MFKLFGRKRRQPEENIAMFTQAADVVRMCVPLSGRVLIHVICKIVENSDMDDDEMAILRMRLDFVRSRRYNKSVPD